MTSFIPLLRWEFFKVTYMYALALKVGCGFVWWFPSSIYCVGFVWWFPSSIYCVSNVAKVLARLQMHRLAKDFGVQIRNRFLLTWPSSFVE